MLNDSTFADSASLAEAPGGFNRLKKCRHGYMLYNINDTFIGQSLDLYGEYSEGEIEVFRELIHPGDIVLEVGANIGAHTIWFAQACAPSGVVLAFEPQRIVYQTLCANVALNSIRNVVCHQVAVSDEEGELTIPVLDPMQPENFGGLELERPDDGDGEPVAVMTLDELPLQACRLIKVDVEGMELKVLKGGRELIDRLKPVLYVENDRDDRALELARYIDSIGYDMYWHVPMLFNPDNYFKNPDNVFERVASKNMFCAPKGTPVSGLTPVKL